MARRLKTKRSIRNRDDVAALAMKAVDRHVKAGTTILGTLLVIRFEGCEVSAVDAEHVINDVGLNVDHMPDVRDRSALRKALHSLGIMPAARHGRKGSKKGQVVTDEDSCLRYSRVTKEGTILVSIRKERVTQDKYGDPTIVDEGEVQRITYDVGKRELVVHRELLRQDIKDQYSHWRGAFKSDSIRNFVNKTLSCYTRAVKFAGSTWFVPHSASGEDTIDKLRQFSRKLPSAGISFTAVQILDEPGGKSDLVHSARQAVEEEMKGLAERLANAKERRKEGVKVRDSTVEQILDEGRELREKLRTLEQILNMESRTVKSHLDQLQAGVEEFLLEDA